jgi:hypothetical protein
MFSKLVIFIIVFSVSFASSAAIQTQGRVKGFYINNSGTALLKLEGNIAECGTNGNGGWDFQYDAASSTDLMLHQVGNQWTSMILAARMAGVEVRIGYEPATSPGGYCKLSYVYFYQESM